MSEIKKENFSYSKLEQYVNCPFAYKLKYIDKKFYGTDTLITLLGTLLHSVEEKISLSLREGKSPNYDELIDYLHNVNIPKKSPFDTEGGIYGLNILKDRFPTEYYEPSLKTGLSYFNKVASYINNIRRQEEFMLAHPELEIWDVEHPFLFEYSGHTMKGFIDRVLKYKGKDQYILQDIKTRDKVFPKEDVPTPLQFVVYSLALKQELKLAEEPSECSWDLILIQELQQAGTKGFIGRGCKKLD
ncbi:MAG: PD-(D/E)XK nuclease family protein, partial [Muribaculaceae bacterium]|nr:PD-(D/E)XK nuclease family protein [Muribaculaceae bacterium]